jgi:hypothetical protein
MAAGSGVRILTQGVCPVRGRAPSVQLPTGKQYHRIVEVWINHLNCKNCVSDLVPQKYHPLLERLSGVWQNGAKGSAIQRLGPLILVR